MSIEPGQLLLHYRAVQKIGEGGMGVVWKAIDTKLDRPVAIKLLPAELARETERLARFDREAKLLASLNQRNIAAIHGVEQTDGLHFLVMELVEGEDLEKHLRRGPLPVKKAIDVARQIARALEAAHDGGVVHRDLKPANVKLDAEDRVKVLDFGLAKAFAPDSGSDSAHLSLSPTMTTGGTQAGVILGTAAYMSPEQARGRPVDKRSDIWSFGCVLYECLTGRQLFGGETLSDTLAMILTREPDWTVLPAAVPARVRELLERCLARDLKDRLRDIGDARQELERAAQTDVSGGVAPGAAAGVAVPAPAAAAAPRRRGLPMLVGGLVLGTVAGAGGLALWQGSRAPASSSGGEVTRLSITYPRHLRSVRGALSPDGRTVVIGGRPRQPESPEDDVHRLYARRLESSEWTLVAGQQNEVRGWDFSPDSRWLSVVMRTDRASNESRLWKIPLDGSTPPLALASWDDNWGDAVWLPDGDLITHTRQQEIVRIPTDGGPPREPVKIDLQGGAEFFGLSGDTASILPGGRHVFGVVPRWSEQGYRVDIAVIDVNSGEARIVLENGATPRWSATGHLLFSRVDTVLAVPFDPVSLTTTGPPLAVSDGLYEDQAWDHGWFDLSSNGALAYHAGGLVGQSRKLVWVDPETLQEGATWSDDRRPFEDTLVFSRDGSHLVAQIPDARGLYDCWVSEVDRPALRRLVDEPGQDCIPRFFTPDSRELVYVLNAAPDWRLYRRPVDGTGAPELLFENSSTEEFYTPTGFTADGAHLLLRHFSPGPKNEILLLPLEAGADGSRATTRLLADATNARYSADGRLFFYGSEVSGKWQSYVRPVAADGSFGRALQLTTDGGSIDEIYPARSDGTWDLWHGYKNKIHRVSITADPELRITGRDLVGEWNRDWVYGEQLRDGRVLAVARGDDEIDEHSELTVVLNWTEELRRRLAAGGSGP